MTRRGQLVLAAAALVAVALIPVVAAYLQLGYVPQTDGAADGRPGGHADRVLTRAVGSTSPDLASSYTWSEREDAVDAFRGDLASRLDALRTSRLTDGTAYVVEYAPGVARNWTTGSCPGGPDRQFGGCEVVDGVLVQDRDGRTHVVAVAFRVRVVGSDGSAELVFVVER